MSKLSDYLENKVPDHLLRATAFSAPSTIYCAAHTADPGETGANEVSGGGYLRTAVSAFDAAASRATANTNEILFSALTAAVGTVTHFSLWDAQSGGNMLWYSSAIATSIVTAVGQVISIGA